MLATPAHLRATTVMQPSSRQVEHTAEVCVHVRAPSLGELAAEAGRALARLELATPTPSPSGPSREIEVWATDRAALLVDWLNELIYLAETERWVAAEFDVLEASDTGVRMRARGVPVAEGPARVKAATFAGLEIRPIPGGLEAEIVLDV
ncbi:MAG TPA: archease [Gemmatimonadales bacterium]|jgi:SHS2 domain-containing protein